MPKSEHAILDSRWAARARSIAEYSSDDFGALVAIGGFDTSRAFRFQDLSGVSFRNADLRPHRGNPGPGLGALGHSRTGAPAPFDFTGARLLRCDFTDALIEGAIFDQAELDRALPNHPLDVHRTDLTNAKDWERLVTSWQHPLKLTGDDHLSVGSVFKDAPFSPEMVVVPSGTGFIGSDDSFDKEDIRTVNPRRSVHLDAPFAVGRFTVTADEWLFAQAHAKWYQHTGLEPRRPNGNGWGRGRRPVIDVSWTDARAYIRWLCAITGRSYRLLSEDEWEYCCRSGTTTRFFWGEYITKRDARFDAENLNDKTAPVGSFRSNAWGLYDMHGNVEEWCEDLWLPVDTLARRDFLNRGMRVTRGGSWFDNDIGLSSARRNGNDYGQRHVDVGFRVARALSSNPP